MEGLLNISPISLPFPLRIYRISRSKGCVPYLRIGLMRQPLYSTCSTAWTNIPFCIEVNAGLPSLQISISCSAL